MSQQSIAGRTTDDVTLGLRGSANGRPSNILHRRGVGRVLAYSASAVLLSVFGVVIFNALDQNTEFAVAVLASVIGGFLGALLALSVITDSHTRMHESRGGSGTPSLFESAQGDTRP